jgi:hypothetical protein
LFLAIVANVSIEGRGTLTLDFTDGAKLTVPPNETYDSWELSGDGVPGILVGPGGETDWTEGLRGLVEPLFHQTQISSGKRRKLTSSEIAGQMTYPQVRPPLEVRDVLRLLAVP